MPPQFFINLTFAPPETRTSTSGAFSSTKDFSGVADMTSLVELHPLKGEEDMFSDGGGLSFPELGHELGLNGSYDPNSTFSGTTTFVNGWGGSLYPSGYSVLEITAIALFITFAMIVVVVGNMLVIIAIATENSLKHITNWFIASLAVADLLLGLVIMPFSLANLLMGYWVFGELWCELHSAIDVLLSTASINNICLISLDRYWSITHAVDYLKHRTPTKSAIMIVAVWIISGLISIPPLLGWKMDRPPEEFPRCTIRNYTDKYEMDHINHNAATTTSTNSGPVGMADSNGSDHSAMGEGIGSGHSLELHLGYSESVLFPGLMTDSIVGFFVTCLIVVILTFLVEILRFYISKVETKLLEIFHQRNKDRVRVFNCQTVTDSHETEQEQKDRHSSPEFSLLQTPTLSSSRLCDRAAILWFLAGLGFMLSNFMSIMFMLIAMTYNVYLILSVCVGLSCGKLFALNLKGRSVSQTLIDGR